MNLDHLPDTPRGKYDALISEEVDEAIRKYWNTKSHKAIAEALGVPVWKLLARYRELNEV